MNNEDGRYKSGFEATDNPFQTLPDGLDDPSMLLAFSRLAHSDYGKPSDSLGAKLASAVTRARAAAVFAGSAFINQIAPGVGRSAKK